MAAPVGDAPSHLHKTPPPLPTARTAASTAGSTHLSWPLGFGPGPPAFLRPLASYLRHCCLLLYDWTHAVPVPLPTEPTDWPSRLLIVSIRPDYHPWQQTTPHGGCYTPCLVPEASREFPASRCFAGLTAGVAGQQPVTRRLCAPSPLSGHTRLDQACCSLAKDSLSSVNNRLLERIQLKPFYSLSLW